MILYKATSPSGKIYIGITCRSLEKRMKEHKSHSVRKTCYHYKLYRAIRKYGFDSFTWEVVDTGNSYEELKFKEVEYIRFYDSKKSGYNGTDGGDGVVGRRANPSTIEKNRINGKKFWESLSAEEKEFSLKRLSSYLGQNVNKIIDGFGNIFESQREAGKFHNLAESVVHIALKNKRPTRSGVSFKYYRGKFEKFCFKKKVRAQVKIKDQNGIVYESSADASRKLNISTSCICEVLNGKRKSTKGYSFKRLVEDK